MNILQIAASPDTRHGSELSMHYGAEGLRALGHQTFLLHAQTGRPDTADDYAAEIGLPALFDRDSKLPPAGLSDQEERLAEFVARHRIDVFHIHVFPRTDVLRRWVRRYRVVASAHTPLCPNGARYFWRERCACERAIGVGCLTTGYARKGCGHLGNGAPMGLPGFLRAMVEDRWLRAALGECSRIIAPSAWMAGRLEKDGIPGGKMRLVNEAIVDNGEGADWTPPEDPPVVAYVGRLVEFKGPDHLLRASARVTTPHRLWLIGDGPMRQDLERMADDLGLRERVTFFGALPPAQLPEYRRRSSVVVVPSLWQDNFPLVGPESMLTQRPIVAYRVGGIPEWCRDGQTGRLVAPGDVAALGAAIEGLLRDPAEARRMGEAGRALALGWVPARHAARLCEVYREALGALPESAATAPAGGSL